MADNSKSFRDRLFLLLPLFLFALVVINCWCFFSLRSRLAEKESKYVSSLVAFTNELYNIRSAYTSQVSNLVLRSSSSVGVNAVTTNSDVAAVHESASIDEKELCLAQVKYRYLLYFGRRVIRYWGRYFEEGSQMSYGRISRIYPDRVYFEDGSYISNTWNPDDPDFVHRDNFQILKEVKSE